MAPGCIYDHTVVFLNADFVRERLGAVISKSVLAFSSDRLIRGLVDVCSEAASPDAAFSLFADGWVYQAIAQIAWIAGVNVECDSSEHGGLSARNLRRIEEFLDANFSEAVTLSDLAAVAGLSTRHFLRAFRESKGITPHQYLIDRRIDAAKKLLHETDESASSIALACGFSSSQHFSTTFRRCTAFSPSSFRKQRY
jgi:AraC family transcriptional regulator